MTFAPWTSPSDNHLYLGIQLKLAPPTYAKLPDKFFRISNPAKFSAPKLLAFNRELANQLGVDHGNTSEEDLAAIFSGQKRLEGSVYLSMAYAGHQFGHFVPQLGDGRAMLLGEFSSGEGKNFEVQLKGSGPTFYSRNGDGFSALGSVIREYLVSEAMFHLGVPTTRALAAVLTGDRVYRQGAFPGAVFTRVASSHLRIGTFQFFASRKDLEAQRILLDYAIDRHYPHLKNDEGRALGFFREVMRTQVALVSHWMSLGFIHGVMNTDNTTLSGETIDYGPCAFMDHFQYDKVFSYIDQLGRYCYKNQKNIMIWNLARLADSLIPLLGGGESEAIEVLNCELQKISEIFDQSLSRRMANKFGFEDDESRKGEQVAKAFLGYLEKEKLDFTSSFRKLPELLKPDDRNEGEAFPLTLEFRKFKELWLKGLAGVELQGAVERMNRNNPVYIPRNHQVERVIQHAEEGDLKPFDEMTALLRKPFERQSGKEAYENAPLPSEEIVNTFCGT